MFVLLTGDNKLMRLDTGMGKITIVVFGLLVMASTAAASPAELDIFPQESTAVVDSYTSYEVVIENTGTTEDRYRLSSSHPNEIDIAPTRIPEEGNLAPGESKTAQIWFNPNLDRREGRYDFSITATSSASGERYSVDGVVNIVREHDVKVDVDNPGVVCRGEEAVYSVFVSNDGTQQETFRLSAEGGDLSQNRVTVNAGDTETVELVRSSDIAVDDRSFNIKASSTSSYAQDTVSTSFTVENCYETSMTVNPDSQDVAAFTEASFDVNVVNEGTRSVQVPLSSSIGELEDNELNIASGDSQSTTLAYTPEELGEKVLEVEASGNAPSSASASANVFNGQDMDLRFTNTQTTVCEDERFQKELTVENTGASSDTFQLSTDRGELSESEIELSPGQERRVDVSLDSSQYDSGQSYDVEASAEAQKFGEPVKTEVASFNVENCFDLEMDVVEEVESAGENRSVIYEISLTNTGTQTNSYTVSVDAPEWITVRPGQISVLPGETEKSYIYAGIPYNQSEGTIDITATATGTQVERSQTVQLIIGDEVRDSIESPEGGSLTGEFFRSVSGLFQDIASTGNTTKVLLSLFIAVLLSAVILYREW